MMIYVVGGLLVLVTMVALFRPMFTVQNAEHFSSHETNLYKDQLAEIKRDLDRGVLTSDQATAAKTEVERRLLNALRREDTKSPSINKTARMVVIAIVAAFPLAAGGLYAWMGAPQYPGQAYATRDPGVVARLPVSSDFPQISRQIKELERNAQANPNDVDAQATLARAYAEVGDFENSIAAYRRANLIVGGNDRALAGELAEVMVTANNGVVPQDAVTIFRFIKINFPNDPQATYYLALAKAQAGDPVAALADLTALRRASPADAPWLPTVDGLIAQIEGSRAPDSGFVTRGPTEDQIAAASQMSESDRAAMIQGMVDGLAARLEAEPDNVDGWRQLAQAYVVLGDDEKAARAFREVLSRAPDDAAAKSYLAERP